MGALAKGESQRPSSNQFSWRSADSDGLSVVDIEKYTAQYLSICRDAFSQVQHYTIATDKAWANGLPLQNSLVATPRNLCGLCPPQARSMSTRRPLGDTFGADFTDFGC